MRVLVKSSVVVLVLWLLGIASAGAQTFRGGISGRITDESGAVLPGVAVTATNTATGVSRSTVTSTTGDFSLPDLSLGTYSVEAKLEGFQPQKASVEVTVSKVTAIDLKLGVSQLSETLQVSAASTALDLQSLSLIHI